MRKALVIEDQPAWQQVLCQQLIEAQLQPEISSWKEGLAKLKDRHQYSLIVLDLFDGDEPYPTGLHFLDEMKKKKLTTPVIVVTGELSVRKNLQQMRSLFHDYGIFDYFEKTSFSPEFRKSVERILDRDDWALATIKKLCERLPFVAAELKIRHDKRPGFVIDDEYDVQDLFRALLVAHFEDVRSEEWAPSYGGKSARMDLLLKNEKIVVEVKKTRPNLRGGEVSEQLILDVAKYADHPDCAALVCLVYDPDQEIRNAPGVEADIVRLSRPGIRVVPIIVPRSPSPSEFASKTT